jgi:ribosomal protein S18 acetylase RimI-like enzyme
MSTQTSTTEAASPRVATPADTAVVTRILVAAFDDDPMWGPWAFPEPGRRWQQRESLFRLLVEGAMRYAWVWLAAEDRATAVWIPPGGSELTPAQEQQVDAVLRDSLGDRADVVLQAFEMFAEARPAEPHYYLTLFGTDPRHVGLGVGQRLLVDNLRQVDAQGEAAYLEAGDELVGLYQRFGFQVRRRFQLSDGPTVNTMWRDPRPASPDGA